VINIGNQQLQKCINCVRNRGKEQQYWSLECASALISHRHKQFTFFNWFAA